MVPPLLVGLVGRSRVGKDTVASFFSDTHTVTRLAKPIKEACKAIYGWDDAVLETDLKEVLDPRVGVSPRLAMIHMTQAIRTFTDPEFFTRRLFDAWDGTTPIVIPDVRYDHDVREIHKRGGVTIKVTRPGCPRHVAEDTVDDLCTTYEVQNDGTVDELRVKVTGLVFIGTKW